jgi:hypothetical protein
MKRWETNQVRSIVGCGGFYIPYDIVRLGDISIKENGREFVKVEINGKIDKFPVSSNNRLSGMRKIRNLIEGANRFYCELDGDIIRIKPDIKTSDVEVDMDFLFMVSDKLKIPVEKLREKKHMLKEYKEILDKKSEIENKLEM